MESKDVMAVAEYSIDAFMPVLILIGLTIAIVLGGHFISVLVSPHRPSKLKSTPLRMWGIAHWNSMVHV